MDEKWDEHEGNEIEYSEWWQEEFEDEEEEHIPRKLPAFLRLAALLVLLAFLGISLPNIPDLWTDRFEFLQQNQSLQCLDVVKESRPAVVALECREDFAKGTEVRIGTGFIIHPTGIILTNQHVVEGSRPIKITLEDGRSYITSQVEQLGEADAAVLFIPGQKSDLKLPYLELELDREVAPAEMVTFIGNPMGIERVASQGEVGQYYLHNDSVIFDIKIPTRGGSSGSPVLDSKGKVVGIVFAITQENEKDKDAGRTLAIPMHTLSDQLSDVLKD